MSPEKSHWSGSAGTATGLAHGLSLLRDDEGGVLDEACNGAAVGGTRPPPGERGEFLGEREGRRAATSGASSSRLRPSNGFCPLPSRML